MSSTNGKSPLGLVVNYGTPGGGKSTDITRTFQNHLFLVTSRNTLDPYVSFRETDAGRKLNLKPLAWEKDRAGRDVSRPPALAARVLPDNILQPDGSLTTIDTWREIKSIVIAFAQAVAAGKCPYKGLVFDEYSKFSARVWDQLATEKEFRTSKGTLNGYARSDAMREFNGWIAAVARASGSSIILVCHEKAPTYDMEDGSPTKGRMKYKGGPQIVPATNISSMCAEADVVLRLVIEKNIMDAQVTRKYQTEVDPEWESKFRDFRIAAQEPLDLRGMLERAGYGF